MGTAAGLRQKGAFQMGSQQAAAAISSVCTGFSQHGQGLAQRSEAAGHQGRRDRLDTVLPQPLLQLLQSWQICGGQLGECQTQPTVDLQIDAAGTDPVPLPRFSSLLHRITSRHGADGLDVPG